MVDIDDFVREAGDKFWRQDAHILGQHHVIRFVGGDSIAHSLIVFFAAQSFMADQLKRNTKRSTNERRVSWLPITAAISTSSPP